ncbi:MAG: hypothetical protein ACOC1F_01180 [Myxococcota bacterium]
MNTFDTRHPAAGRFPRAFRSRVGSVLAAGAACILAASPAQASDGSDGGRSTTAVVLLAMAAGAVYLAFKVVLDRARQKLLWVPGVEHLALGLLLGPMVFGLGVFREPAPMAPFAALAAGWVALSCGTDFNLRALSDPPRGGPRLGVLSAVLCGTAVTIAARIVFTSGWFGRVDSDDAWLVAGWMGCAASAASNTPLEAVQKRFETADALPLLLRRSVRFANLLAIIAFGVLTCIFRPGYGWEDRPLSPVELAVVAVGLGSVLGVVLSPYFGRVDSLAGRVLVLAAMVAFATGAASWLGLSTLWVSLAMGAVLVNISLVNDRLVEAVRVADAPAVLVLLVLAGALWSPPPFVPALTITAGFVILRFFGRMLASWLVAKWLAPMRVDTGRGLLGQGAVAVALAIAFRITSEGPLVDLGYTAILASVLLHDLVAPWALRGLLLDAGELRRPAEAKV